MSLSKNGEKRPVGLVNLCSSSGAALPLVLFFAICAFIIATVYLSHQRTLVLPSLDDAAQFQAQLNARSGVWRAWEKMVDSTRAGDSLGPINTRDPRFNEDQLFDSLVTSDGAVPESVRLYTVDSLGLAIVSIEDAGNYRRIASLGTYRSFERKTTALVGGLLAANSDTVLVLESPTKPTGGRLEGEYRSLMTAIPTIRVGMKSPPVQPQTVRQDALKKLVDSYTLELASASDSVLPGSRTLIKDADDLDALPDIVSGNLDIHSSFRGMTWRSKRTIAVLGDLQCTGDAPFLVEDVTLIVNGSAQFFDRTTLKNVTIFTRGRFILGDYAEFYGDALSLTDAFFYGSAKIGNRSVVTVAKKSGEKKGGGNAAADTVQRSGYQIDIAENVKVDATLIALGGGRGIRTGQNVTIRGIFLTDGAVCHMGRMEGLIHAKSLVDCRIENPDQGQPGAGTPATTVVENVLVGSIGKLKNLGEYRMPFYIGTPRIISWSDE